MSGPSREKDTADYDLERFVEMFDQAMTSDDPRVKNALRQLMMMVILTDVSDHEAGRRASHGPLRQLIDDMQQVIRKMRDLENEVNRLKYHQGYNQITAARQEGGQGGGFGKWPPMSEQYKLSVEEQANAMQKYIADNMQKEAIARKINGGLNTKVKKTNIGEE